jgi:hypothetical protein
MALVNTGVAPVCNAKADQPKFTPKVTPLGSFIPVSVTDPTSITTAIQQIQQTLTTLTNTTTTNPATLPGGSYSGSAGGPSYLTGGGYGNNTQDKTQNKASKEGKWRETKRVQERVKIVNPDDDSQYVTFRRINKLVFTNSATGETLTWSR